MSTMAYSSFRTDGSLFGLFSLLSKISSVSSGAARCSSHHLKSPQGPTEAWPISLANLSRYILLLFCGGRKNPGMGFHKKKPEGSFGENRSNIAVISKTTYCN